MERSSNPERPPVSEVKDADQEKKEQEQAAREEAYRMIPVRRRMEDYWNDWKSGDVETQKGAILKRRNEVQLMQRDPEEWKKTKDGSENTSEDWTDEMIAFYQKQMAQGFEKWKFPPPYIHRRESVEVKVDDWKTEMPTDPQKKAEDIQNKIAEYTQKRDEYLKAEKDPEYRKREFPGYTKEQLKQSALEARRFIEHARHLKDDYVPSTDTVYTRMVSLWKNHKSPDKAVVNQAVKEREAEVKRLNEDADLFRLENNLDWTDEQLEEYKNRVSKRFNNWEFGEPEVLKLETVDARLKDVERAWREQPENAQLKASTDLQDVLKRRDLVRAAFTDKKLVEREFPGYTEAQLEEEFQSLNRYARSLSEWATRDIPVAADVEFEAEDLMTDEEIQQQEQEKAARIKEQKEREERFEAESQKLIDQIMKSGQTLQGRHGLLQMALSRAADPAVFRRTEKLDWSDEQIAEHYQKLQTLGVHTAKGVRAA